MALTPFLLLQLSFVSKNEKSEQLKELAIKRAASLSTIDKFLKANSSKYTGAHLYVPTKLLVNISDIEQIDFDLNRDRLVFFHIQKTSGTNFDVGFIKQVLVNKNGKWRKGCEGIRVPRVIQTKIKSIKRKVYSTEFACKRAQYLSWKAGICRGTSEALAGRVVYIPVSVI